MSSSSSVSPFILTASDIAYDNANSGLSATNLQDAIDEIAGSSNPHEYQVQTLYSNPWSGYPTETSGTAYGVCGGSVSIVPFTGTISPGALAGQDGLALGYVVDDDTGEVYFALFVADGSLDGAKYLIEGPGLPPPDAPDPLRTELMTPTNTAYGLAYVWGLSPYVSSVDAPWNAESSFAITITPY